MSIHKHNIGVIADNLPGDTMSATGSGPRAYTSLQSLIPSTVFELDATLTSSYPGTGTDWFNLCDAPADGLSSQAYRFVFGSTSAAEANDPTFNGVADNMSAFHSFDGGDFFQIAGGNTAFFNAMCTATASASDFWVAWCGNVPGSSQNAFIGFTNTAGNIKGFALFKLTSNVVRLLMHYGGANNQPNLVSVTASQNILIVVTHKTSGAKTNFWRFPNTTVSVCAGGAASAGTNPAQKCQIGAIGDGNAGLINGSKIFAVAMGNSFLTTAEACAIYDTWGTRHGRNYKT